MECLEVLWALVTLSTPMAPYSFFLTALFIVFGSIYLFTFFSYSSHLFLLCLEISDWEKRCDKDALQHDELSASQIRK